MSAVFVEAVLGECQNSNLQTSIAVEVAERQVAVRKQILKIKQEAVAESLAHLKKCRINLAPSRGQAVFVTALGALE